jgi:hypothetical protein
MSNFTTELEAVNTMLSAVGSQPVSSLDAGAEVAIAKNILRETRREVLSRGWSFNYETEVKLTPVAADRWIHWPQQQPRPRPERHAPLRPQGPHLHDH